MKKSLIFCFLFIGLSTLLTNCKKNINETNALGEKSKTGTSSPTMHRSATDHESSQLAKFMETEYWKNFTEDNPGFSKEIDLKGITVQSWTDGTTKEDLIQIYMPIADVERNSYIILSGTKYDFDNSYFDNLQVIFLKDKEVQYLDDTIPYGISYVEIYGMPGEWTTTGTLIENGQNVSYSITHDESYHYLSSERYASPVLPTLNCINTGLNNLAEMNSSWTFWHNVLDLVTAGTVTVADIATCTGWCVGHNNHPYPTP